MAGNKKIDEPLVRKVAKLARLDLSDNEIGEFADQLSGILDYVDKMNQLDTTGVEPLAHCLGVRNVFREDVPRPSLQNEQAMQNAPEKEQGYFKVPKILDEAP